MSKIMDGGDRVDMRVFTLSVLLLAGVVGPLLLFPESSTAMISSAFSFTTGKFGWLYMVAGLATVVFLVGLAFSRYGNVRLGGADDTPEFSYFSWIAMIFCGGIGIAIVNWAWVEPIYYYTGPPIWRCRQVAGGRRVGVDLWSIPLGADSLGVSTACRPSQLPIRCTSSASPALACQWLRVACWASILTAGWASCWTRSWCLALWVAWPPRWAWQCRSVSKLASGLFGIETSFVLDMSMLALWTLDVWHQRLVWTGQGHQDFVRCERDHGAGHAAVHLFGGPDTVHGRRLDQQLWSDGVQLHLDEHLDRPHWKIQLLQGLDRVLLGVVDCLCTDDGLVCGPHFTRSHHS